MIFDAPRRKAAAGCGPTRREPPRRPPGARLIATARGLVAASTGAIVATASAFALKAEEAGFVVDVPGLPEIAARAAPVATGAAQLPRYAGHGAGHDVTIETSAGREGISTRECAGRFLRGFTTRPDAPDAESLYRAPLGPQTFLVIYVREDGPVRQLHAHLLGATSSGRCVDAHFWRPARPDQDDDAWRQSFSGARVE